MTTDSPRSSTSTSSSSSSSATTVHKDGDGSKPPKMTTGEKNNISNTSSSKVRFPSSFYYWFQIMLRSIMIDLPLAAMFLLWISTVLLLHLHDEYFDKQLQLMKFIEAGRDYRDTTYFHRVCTEQDITTTDVKDLIIPKSFSTQQCADHMLLHGASLYPNLLTQETASTLRQFIDEQNSVQQGWFVINNENRYSWGIDINMHPALHTFWKELASNQQLVEALEKIVGPDPAVIEFTAITSSYGAEDQFDHSDVVSPGSAAKFGRSFVPSYSLFIPLQNVTYDMGATHVCPGTHLCSAGGPTVCPKNHNNVALSGGKGRGDPNDGIWEVGAGALVNQQTTHKGMGYSLEGGPDRVVIIATFAPRPRFSQTGLETRMIGQGGSYSILWSQNGHTFSDFVHASTRMTEPQKTLRSLGLIKGNGWNWPTVSSMRISNEDNGFDGGPLGEFVDDGGFWFLPESWQQLDYRPFAASHDLLHWHAMVLGTIIKTSNELARINWTVLVGHIGLLLVFDLIYTFVISRRGRDQQNKKPAGSFVMRGLLRIGITHGTIVALAWLVMHSVRSTNWARNIRAGRAFHLPYQESNGQPCKSTIPTRTDILMDYHYSSSYLASYANVIDENHPGNRYWKEIARNYGPAYSKFIPAIQLDLCQSVVDSSRSDRRFLRQDFERFWGNVDDNNELLSFCHREMFFESSPTMRAVLKTIDQLQVETQYGQLRDTSLHRIVIPGLLDSFEGMILPPIIQKATTDESTWNTWKVPHSFLHDLPDVSGSLSYSRKYSLPPILPPTEPFRGAWFQEGDDVEVKYQCRFNGALHLTSDTFFFTTMSTPKSPTHYFVLHLFLFTSHFYFRQQNGTEQQFQRPSQIQESMKSAIQMEKKTPT
mmetsp:Transcript_8393/g.20908  ORF Transcript_8393/g.20908 Transcript_8393/m.20908 type:complete len:877 (-) Transcript_8393:455-3085(-)